MFKLYFNNNNKQYGVSESQFISAVLEQSGFPLPQLSMFSKFHTSDFLLIFNKNKTDLLCTVPSRNKIINSSALLQWSGRGLSS